MFDLCKVKYVDIFIYMFMYNISKIVVKYNKLLNTNVCESLWHVTTSLYFVLRCCHRQHIFATKTGGQTYLKSKRF